MTSDQHGAHTSHVLSLCDRTGNMVRPWAEAGHVCIAVDTAHDGVTVEDCKRVPENVAYNTRQCRRCGFHDERDPREVQGGSA